MSPNLKYTEEQFAELAAADQQLAQAHSTIRALTMQGLAAGAEPTPPLDSPVPPTPEPDEPAPPDDELPEGSPFEEGGEFAWLPDRYQRSDWPGWMQPLHNQGVLSLASAALETMPAENVAISAGWNSPDLQSLASVRNAHVLPVAPGDSIDSMWLRRVGRGLIGSSGPGPLFHVRVFNAIGTLRRILAARTGAFQTLREGHAVYLNATASPGSPETRLKELVSIQSGAQSAQIVFRKTEDGQPIKLPQELWPENVAGSRLVLNRLASIDDGVIAYGPNPRASHPFSIFTTGHHETEVSELFVRCDHAKPFQHKSLGPCRSHGFLLAYPSFKREVFSEHLVVRDNDVEITDPDRSLMRFGSYGEVELRGGRYIQRLTHADAKAGGISVLNNVNRLIIDSDVGWSGTVRVYTPGKPYNNPILTVQHHAGTRTTVFPGEGTFSYGGGAEV